MKKNKSGMNGTGQSVEAVQDDLRRQLDKADQSNKFGDADGGIQGDTHRQLDGTDQSNKFEDADGTVQDDLHRQSDGNRYGTRFRQYGVWLQLLFKRLWRQPAYLALLALIPVLGAVIGMLEQKEPGGVQVAVCVEDGTWGRQITEGLKEQAAESILQFVFCDSEETVRRSVMKGEADCGFVLPEDLAERVMGGDWEETVRAYEMPASSITGMAKERIAGVIFTLYSERCYEEYMEENLGDINTASYKMVDFARKAYQKRLTDGTTFSFRYENGDQYSQYASDTNAISDTGVFPLKGVFGVLIFICGMCGMLEYDRDRQEKRFVRMVPNWLAYIVDVWIPTIFASFAVIFCLWLSEGLRYRNMLDEIGAGCSATEFLFVWNGSMWAEQILHLVAYQCVIIVYCCILGIMLRRRETIAAAIPILTLGSFVCAPVFIRLAAYIPAFAVLEKLFPVTYYLI